MNANNMGNHELLTDLVGVVLTAIIAEKDMPWPGHEYLKDLNWRSVSSPWSVGFSCLPKSGGLCWADVEFLMKLLRDEAEPIQRVCRTSNILGFGTLLFLFWQHTLLMGGKALPARIILNLIARYWPHATQGEGEILLFMFDWAHTQTDEPINSRIVSKDMLDMSSLVETYTSIIANPPTSPKFLKLHDAVTIIETLANGSVDMVPRGTRPLILSVLDRGWIELVASRRPKDVEEIMQLCGLALSLSFSFSHNNDLLFSLLPPLSNEADIDYINLMGRLVVLGLKSALRSADPMPLKNLLFKSNLFLDVLERASAPMVETFKHGHRDWLKVARWIDFQYDLLGHGHSQAQEAWVCSNGWYELGAAFGCVEQIVQVECASPRCFGELATVSCGQCLTAAYCSIRCQMM
ncbi:hypothetical protein FRC08_017946 [Ceratobasidium sp. 394]|nr:hypothetical protein FRC08_017946 [Ceratobasidium sp. 394]